MGNVTATGTVVLSKTQDLIGTANKSPALIVGGVATSTYLEIDANEIQAKHTDTTVDPLYLNNDGGVVYLSGTKISASGDDFAATNITASSMTSNTLNVTDTFWANDFDFEIQHVIDGIMRIAPTLRFPSANTSAINVTKPDANTVQIAITDTGITTSTMAGIVWTEGSRVKVSGTINGIGTETMTGTITNFSAGAMTVSVNGGKATDVTATSTLSAVENLTVMVYERKNGSVYYPTGIIINCYDAPNQSATIRVYGGTDTKPNVLIGNLSNAGLGTVNNITPGGWGLYSQNAFLWGTMVATAGKIGDWTISENGMFYTDKVPGATTVTLIPTGTDASSTSIGGSSGSKSWVFTVKNLFGVDTEGALYSKSGQIGGWTIANNALYTGVWGTQNSAMLCTGSGSSDPKSIGGSDSISGWVFTAGSKFGVTKSGALYASSAEISGKITANSGSIAGWRIESTYLASGTATAPAANTLLLSPAGTASSYTVAGTAKSGWMITAGTTFGVNKDGGVYATSGEIGGWTIGTSSLYNTTNSMTSTGVGLYLGTDGIRNYASATKYVNITGGKITALGVDVSGKITATEGAIGGFDITSTAIKTKNVAVTSNADNSISLSSADFTRTINSTPREGLRFAIGDKFGVTGDGTIYAGSANISGTLSAGANSTIGPWTVSKTSIYKGSNSIDSTSSTAAYFGNDGLSIGGLVKIDARSSAATTISLGNTSSSNISISSSGLMINDNGTSMATFNSDGIEMRGTNGQILLDINTTGDPTSARESFGTSIPAPFTSGQRRVFDIEDLGDHFGNFVGDGQIATSIVENGQSGQQVVDYLEKSFTEDFSVSCLNGKATLSYSYSQKKFILTFNQAIENVSSVGVLFIWVYSQYPHNYTFGTRDNNYDKGVGSATIGHNLINTNANALVVGEYNSDDNYLFAVGNGTNALSRSNAFTVDNYGVVGFSGVAMFGDPGGTFYVTSHTVVNNASVASQGYKDGTITIEKTGYYPLCVAGYNSNTRYLTPTRFYISDQQSGSASLHYMIFNPTSSARTGTCTMWVMWVKTT